VATDLSEGNLMPKRANLRYDDDDNDVVNLALFAVDCGKGFSFFLP
jgi:hypothetical protein